MDTTWTFAQPLENRQDPTDSGPKGGGMDEVGTGKSSKKTDADSDDDRDTD